MCKSFKVICECSVKLWPIVVPVHWITKVYKCKTTFHALPVNN